MATNDGQFDRSRYAADGDGGSSRFFKQAKKVYTKLGRARETDTRWVLLKELRLLARSRRTSKHADCVL